MQFAKLFNFPAGQLLVERDWVRIGSGGTGYSCLRTKTKHQPAGGGPAVTASTKVVYASAQECQNAFDDYDEGQADRAFSNHQGYLEEGREVNFSTDHEIAFERPQLQRPTESQPVRTQQETT